MKWLAMVLIAAAAACGDPGDGPTGVEPVDIAALFQPATPAEMAAVETDWAARDPGAQAVVEEASSTVLMAGGLGTVRVFSHEVDGARHYGATLVPLGAGAGTLPIVVFAHGGDTGINVDDLLVTLILLGDPARNYAYVVPSFRSERLTAAGSSWVSEGAPSPWDRDVDDALALLDVAIAHVPEADPSRIGVLGASRGGTVGLLMAIRDPRIDRVVELAGPTDFFDSWMRGLVEDAFRDELRPLPGVHVLNDRFFRPLQDGSLSVADARLEIVRRSPVLWADRLPPVQIHHGTADDVVDVSQAESLIAALEALDRDLELDEFYLYPGAGHNVLELQQVDTRILQFLGRLRGP